LLKNARQDNLEANEMHYFIVYKAKSEEKKTILCLPFCKAQHQHYPTGPVAQGLFQLAIYENH
jgi:hypothetical protein